MKVKLLVMQGVLCLTLMLCPRFNEKLFAQSDSASVKKTVSGKITDADGKPVSGATVQVKGTTNMVAASATGEFSLKSVSADAVLIVSVVGFETQEVSVGGQSTITIALKTKPNALEDVVVVGYGTRKKSDVTGAVTQVKAEQIAAVPSQNLAQALQGRAAGVDIAAGNFRPGEAPAIKIRGNRSLLATNDPLYVIDGIPSNANIADFSPLDIESVDVLKDASATAIYGSRAANGVILITTKRGKAGRFSVNYDTYVSIDNIQRKLDLMDGGEFAELRREAYRTTGTYRRTNSDPTLWYADPRADQALFNGDNNMWRSVAQGYEWVDFANLVPKMRATTAAEQAAWGVAEVPVYDASKVRTFDWQDAALRTGISQSHQIRVAGGTEKLRGSFSGNYLDQEGIQKGQDFKRYSAAATLDFKPNSVISFGASMNISQSIQNYGPNIYGRAIGGLPIAQPYDTAGNFVFMPGNDVNILNPLRDDNLVFDERRSFRFFGSFYGEIQFMKGLKYRMNFGPDFRQFRRGRFQASASTERQNGTNIAYNDQETRLSYTLENLVFFDKKLGSNHDLGVTLLQSVQNFRNEGMSISASNLPYDQQKWYALSSTYNGTPDGYGSSYSANKLVSYMARINYTFMSKYLLTLSGRYDGATVLAPGNKGDFFPSFALAWKANEEEFLNKVTWLNELKFRVGYGTVGNSAIGPYQTGGTLDRTIYLWDNTPAYGYAPSLTTGIPSPNLSWEKSSTVNVGIDFGIFKRRITGTVEFYNTSTKDLLMRRSLPGATGYTSTLQNIGQTRNRGVEVSISSTNIDNRSNGFRWTTDVTFMKNSEKLVSLINGKTDDIGNNWFINRPQSVFYDFVYEGIWQNNEKDNALMARYNAKGASFKPGDIRIADLNGDSLFDGSNDRRVIGSPSVPKWSGSVTNTFSYKNFDLSIYVYGRVGTTAAYGSPLLEGRYQEGKKFNYWTPTNPSNEAPRPNRGAAQPLYASSMQYQSGTFFRVRSISLNYNFKKELISKIKANNLSAYVNLVNPFLFTKYDGLDPEVTQQGATSGERSQAWGASTKSVVVGIRVGF
ncbi:TonB-linked SusC/RagA family outer membrane protein [Filimonas zeae]|nr:TonB-dependent receptor [Filimonas zeae]MDR6341440.1 TonB-linked SusC/RagA family outer membrane protein [Filimonas zeae]